MLLERAKRLLTSAWPDSKTACRSNTKFMTKHEHESINIQHPKNCLLSQCLCNNKHLLSDAAKHQGSCGKAKKKDHSTEVKCFEINDKNVSVVSR